MTTSIATGIETLKNALATMAETSGVYQMRAEDGTILYIGKAKNLKNRVSNYTNFAQLPLRLQRMVALVRSVEVVPTENEAAALVMEASLIKKERPRYNVLLKDDKSFPYILFSDHAFPRISKYRGNRQGKGQYFGPFVSVGAMYETMELLQKTFLLRPCSDSIFSNRSRPCLQYQIKRCSAPCVKYINEEEYGGLIKQASRFLNGQAQEIRSEISDAMQAASDAQDYERAAQLRDRLKATTAVQREHAAIPDLIDADVFLCYRENERTCVYVGSYRSGNYLGHEYHFPANTEDTATFEILSLCILNHYSSHPCPKLVIVNTGEAEEMQELAGALKLQNGTAVSVEFPKRGSRVKALERGELLAQDALKRRKASNMFDVGTWGALTELLGLPKDPKRIEIYDNSHIMGAHAIGAMVVATPEGFQKTNYRTFNIKSELVAGDDYAMMREMLSRRLKSLCQTEPPPLAGEGNGAYARQSVSAVGGVNSPLNPPACGGNLEIEAIQPDLMIIDGGVGHLGAALQVLETLGLQHLQVIGVAKGVDRNAGREWIHVPGKEPFQLSVGDARLHLLQNLRDEAHRFAIGTHRRKRSRETMRSELDDIPNIGPKRKKALLQYFGSRKDVASASVQELQKVEGISAVVAKQIFEYFQK